MSSRRQFLGYALSTLPAWAANAGAQPRVPLADMHSHYGMFTRRMDSSGLAEEMRATGVALVAWKAVPDRHWLRLTATGVEPGNVAPQPGGLAASFLAQLQRMRAYVDAQKLLPVLTAADVDRCTGGGEAGIVLASEGADFLEGDVGKLAAAHAAGLRHLQLVHYLPGPLADLQTAAPVHRGLSAFGRTVVEACNAQGILVDLAHSASEAVDQALQVAKRPVVWSHGWVDRSGGQWSDRLGYMQRRLSVDHARRIAQAGGVVGLWGLGLPTPAAGWTRGMGGWTVGRGDTQAYARELLQLVNVLGAEHVAIGSDIEGVGPNWAVNDYAGLRRVVEHLATLGATPSTIERLAFGNYARVLKAALG